MSEREAILASIERARDTVGGLSRHVDAIEAIARAVTDALRAGRKVLTCGNGGSAAEALHMSEELMGRFRSDRRALPAVALTADPTLLTCIANDFGYDAVFARQVEGLGAAGDVLVIFSTSGNGQSLLRAAAAAKKKGVTVVALLGKGGGGVAALADRALIVASDDTARVQEAHQVVMHLVLEAVERAFA